VLAIVCAPRLTSALARTVDVRVNAASDARFDAIGVTAAMTHAHLAIEKIRTELRPKATYGWSIYLPLNSMASWPYAGCEVHALRYPTNAASSA
jgi:hypothetical protein